MGAPEYNSDAGAVYLYTGSGSGLSTTPTTTLIGPSSGEWFGSSLAVGDINGDGYADVIVAAPEYNSSTGAVYVYNGSSEGISSTTASSTLTGSAINESFGYLVAAGDVNGDGYTDIILASTPGVYIFEGGSNGISNSAAATLTPPVEGEGFGSSLAVGDVNGDGYADVIVGADAYSDFFGAIYVYGGSSSGIVTTPTTTIAGPSTSDTLFEEFGRSIAVGDVNGDGYADVVVGAFNYGTDMGAVYVYNGSSNGLSSTAATTLTGSSNYLSFGTSVAIGDVNGDGYADVVVGIPGYNSSTDSICIYDGSNGGISTSASVTIIDPSSIDLFGESVL